MSIRQSALQAIMSAVLSIAACVIYSNIYNKAFEVDFKTILNLQGIIGACVFSSVLMATAYYLVYKWRAERLLGWINILIAVLSFASIVSVLGYQLPLDIESPEMFPGLAVPMHFFPALAFFTISPFFKEKQG